MKSTTDAAMKRMLVYCHVPVSGSAETGVGDTALSDGIGVSVVPLSDAVSSAVGSGVSVGVAVAVTAGVPL